MSWRRRQKPDAGDAPRLHQGSAPHHHEASDPGASSCLLDLIAATWVDLYHAAFVSRSSLEQENERIRMCAVRKDLDTCYGALQTRETDLQNRVSMLERQAVMYKQGKNVPAARKKMMERARARAQLEKIQNSMLMIDMHKSTIEGTELDLSVLETLKASGDVLRQMGATGNGLRAVEDLVSGLEESMQNAAEITNVLSSGSVSGVVNTMAAFGVAVDEEELMRELDFLSTGMGEDADSPEMKAETGTVPTAMGSSSSAQKGRVANFSTVPVQVKMTEEVDNSFASGMFPDPPAQLSMHAE